MNDTPTPRMTEAWSKTSRTADGMYSSTPCHIDIAANCYKEGCVIERELTVVTEQRDSLAAAVERIANNNIQDTPETDYAYELGRMEGIAKIALQSLNQTTEP